MSDQWGNVECRLCVLCPFAVLVALSRFPCVSVCFLLQGLFVPSFPPCFPFAFPVVLIISPTDPVLVLLVVLVSFSLLSFGRFPCGPFVVFLVVLLLLSSLSFCWFPP